MGLVPPKALQKGFFKKKPKMGLVPPKALQKGLFQNECKG